MTRFGLAEFTLLDGNFDLGAEMVEAYLAPARRRGDVRSIAQGC
jgi:hypothetical protein